MDDEWDNKSERICNFHPSAGCPLILWHLGQPPRLHFIVPTQNELGFGWIALDLELTPWESNQVFDSPDAAVAAGVAALDDFLSRLK